MPPGADAYGAVEYEDWCLRKTEPSAMQDLVGGQIDLRFAAETSGAHCACALLREFSAFASYQLLSFVEPSSGRFYAPVELLNLRRN